MKKSLLFSLLLLCLSGAAQTDNNISTGTIDSLHSSILGEQRKLWVYLPYKKTAAPPTGQRYPVLYLLDGDGHFASVVGMIQQLSQVNGNALVPEMIVVAIPNTDRTRDLTPTHIDSDLPMMDTAFSKNTGGGEKFADFFEKELIPHIDSLLPTQPFRMLVGHSFGGLAVMHMLTHRPQLFRAYVAIDPSMWYDKERFLQATQKKLAAGQYRGTGLYVGIANTLNDGMTLKQGMKDTSVATRHIRSIFALDQFIKNNKKNGLRYASKYYPDDDHGSVPLISTYDALRFLFSWYRFRFTLADFMAPDTAVVQRLRQHYQTASEHLGYRMAPPEMQINGLGYQALAQKQYPKALALFRLNMEQHPESGNVYDSYADALLAKGDSLGAAAYYEKALALSKSAETRQKLDLLQGKAAFAVAAADLEKYVGMFAFESFSLTATTSIRNGALWVSAPGYGDSELVPLTAHVFGIKGRQGYTIKFEVAGSKAVRLTAIQPNGTFVAVAK